MGALFPAFLAALIIGVPMGAIALIRFEFWLRILVATGCMIALWTFINWLVFYMWTPTVGFTGEAFWKTFWLWFIMLLTFAIAAGMAAYDWDSSYPTKGTVAVALVTVGALLLGIFQGVGGVWTQNRATSLAELADVNTAEIGEYPETDAEHILQVPRETADYLAGQAISNSKDRNLGTFYERGPGALQSVDEHLYWLYPLWPAGRREASQVNDVVPGYIVVDAEDPNVQAYVRTENTEGEKFQIRYVPGGQFEKRLERHLWMNGYSGSVVTDLTLEVDDKWDPYFTGSRDRLTLNFQPTVPDTLLTVDAQSGDIQEYSLDDMPDWVDLVYSAETVEHMLNWWGEWGAGAPYKLIGNSKGNRFKVPDDEDPVLVYTKGGHPAWQVILTSHNNDTSAAYLALFEGRSNKVTLYTVQGLQLESVAMRTVSGSASANQRKVKPTHPTLHRIYGQLTWVMPLIGNESDAYQGLALMRANDPSGSSVVIARNKSDALTEYRQRLARGNDNTDPNETANTQTAEGTVAALGQSVEGGTTIFYFTLEGDATHLYRAAATADQLELTFIKVGAKVKVTYIDTGTTRRDVGAYDDLGLQLVK